jgi:hypothetical protein
MDVKVSSSVKLLEINTLPLTKKIVLNSKGVPLDEVGCSLSAFSLPNFGNWKDWNSSVFNLTLECLKMLE